jgi:sugar (pentulose or hexulose) kinase
MAACLAVGIDIGTTNTKVALVEIGAGGLGVRAVAAAPTPRPDGLKPLLLRLLRQVLARSAPPGAIGLASMAETGVPLDLTGRPVGTWLRWDGHRAAREAAALSERLGRDELIGATGVRPSAKVPLAVWAWLRTQEPDRWAAMARWAGAADLACLLLTGQLATDHTLAGRTMAYRLPSTGAPLPGGFDPALLAEVGLRPEQLPVVIRGIAGRVIEPSFVSCGLRAGTPVTVGGHDHAVGAYAAGVREPGGVADSLGTAEAVMSVVPEVADPVQVGLAGMSTVVPVTGRHRAILAGNSSAGATLAWWLERESGGLAPRDLFAQAAETRSDPEILVLPYLSGRQAPAPEPSATLRVVGRQPRHGPVELARAMLEGLCLQTRWMLEEQARLAGGSPATVTVLGGMGAANRAWTEIKAQVLPWRLWQVTAAQPVAMGAALLAAVRAGLVGAAVPSLPRLGVPVDGDACSDYDARLARFVKAATG